MFIAVAEAATDIGPLLGKIKTEILTPIATLLIAIAVLYFVWGVFEFIQGAGNDEARKKGKQHMIWGVFGLFIMISVVGILKLICSTLGAGC